MMKRENYALDKNENENEKKNQQNNKKKIILCFT